VAGAPFRGKRGRAAAVCQSQGTLSAITGAALLGAALLCPVLAWPAPPSSAPVSTAAVSIATAPPATAPAAGSYLRDLRGPLPAQGLPPFALTSFALLALGGAGVAWSRAARKPAPPAQAVPETAVDPLQSLGALASSFQSGALCAELLCLQASHLLRLELGRRTGAPAPRLTSAELIQRSAASQLFSDAEIAVAGSMLELCDRVKFGGQPLEQAQAEWLLATLGVFLEENRGERHEVS